MGSLRWVHWLGLKHKVLVMEESGQELLNIIQPQVNISRDTTEQLGRGKRRPGTAGRRQGRGLFLRALVDPSSYPSPPPPPCLLRCLPGFLLSCCQLGSADQSELLTARTNRKA